MLKKLISPLRDLFGQLYFARVLPEIFEHVILIYRRFICSGLLHNLPNLVIVLEPYPLNR